LKKKKTKTETALPELWASFRVPTEFGPMSDRNRGWNLQPSHHQWLKEAFLLTMGGRKI
jgi:hypothetical protein